MVEWPLRAERVEEGFCFVNLYVVSFSNVCCGLLSCMNLVVELLKDQ